MRIINGFTSSWNWKFLGNNKFSGISAKSVTFTLTANGRASGECYVELADVAAAKEARKFDRNEISGRYIEGGVVSLWIILVKKAYAKRILVKRIFINYIF